MEVSVKSICSAFESTEWWGVKSYISHIMGDDYEFIPSEILDEDDLVLLLPTDFQQSVLS